MLLENVNVSMIKRCETKHNQHRRSYWHDYYQKGLYMITMVIDGRKPLFGTIVGHANGQPGTNNAPHIMLSDLGRRILQHEVPKIHQIYPEVEVWRVAMMPDHIHLLLWISQTLSNNKHLGMVIRGFKTGCSRAWWKLQDETVLCGKAQSTTASNFSAAVPAPSPTAAVPVASPTGKRPVLYESGYHDRIINKPGMLENIKRYMEENPLRACIRRECPRLMERQLHLWIGGREYAAFGNLFLLKYPIKEQVFFHRKDPKTGQPTEQTNEYQKEHNRLLRIAEEGTVLVTPGISKGEAIVVDDAIEAHLPLILLQKEPIGKYWKPAKSRFYACAAGHLLILAPWNIDGSSDYASFHQLNDYAREICEAAEMRIIDYPALIRK